MNAQTRSTHQLVPLSYPKDCRSIVGRLVDQCVVILSTMTEGFTLPSDDQVEESNLANGLDVTSEAWQVSMSTCPFVEGPTH